MSLAMLAKNIFDAISGRALDLDAWYEAEAAETRANLRHIGIGTLITAGDIRKQARWSAQARREQLDVAWISQARREEMNLAALKQDGDH